MQDLGNWHFMFRCGEGADRLNPAMNYAYGLTSFAGQSLANAVRDSSDLQGWPTVGQRGPTCGYNGPAKAFQYLLRRFGFSKSDIKEVTHSARLFWCIKFAEQLAAVRCDAGQNDAPLAAAAVPNAGLGSDLWTGAGVSRKHSIHVGVVKVVGDDFLFLFVYNFLCSSFSRWSQRLTSFEELLVKLFGKW